MDSRDLHEIPKRLGNLTYRCQYCGHECVEKTGLPSGLSPTKRGSYGAACTPTPAEYEEELYEASTISFTAATSTEAAQISDSALQFLEKHIISEMVISIETDSGTNDGTYTIASRGVTRSTISLSSSDDVTTESAATAGTVTINRVIYSPNVTGGCGFCGSLNSRG